MQCIIRKQLYTISTKWERESYYFQQWGQTFALIYFIKVQSFLFLLFFCLIHPGTKFQDITIFKVFFIYISLSFFTEEYFYCPLLVVCGRYCACEILIANPIDWLYAACLEYFIFFSIDSSEVRKQYDEYCLSIMQTITYAHDRTHFQGTGWIVPFDLREWNW